MKRLIVVALIAVLATACGTVTSQFNAIHMQATSKLKADIQGVRAVGVASGNKQLVNCADAVLTDQIPALEALDTVQASGVFSTAALVNAKREALKIRPSVVAKCFTFDWFMVGLFGQ